MSAEEIAEAIEVPVSVVEICLPSATPVAEFVGE
jgi:hypothetical protein